MDALEKAKELILSFMRKEYDSNEEYDFPDLEEVPLAYTTITDEELDINVYADLIDCQIRVFIDGEYIPELTEQYKDLEEMNERALKNLDFDDLTYVPYPVLDNLRLIKEDRV